MMIWYSYYYFQRITSCTEQEDYFSLNTTYYLSSHTPTKPLPQIVSIVKVVTSVRRL